MYTHFVRSGPHLSPPRNSTPQVYADGANKYSVSQKNPPLRTCGNFSKMVGNFSTKFYMPIMRSYL